jgi:fibronectin-binding autotransporter adhesin
MAGGAGGTGGSPNGAAGAAGASASGNNFAPGGAGGNNNFTITDGTAVFGPYGQGGNGADSTQASGQFGNSGGVVLIWGSGLGS